MENSDAAQKKEKWMEKIKGHSIAKLRTLGSKYDNGKWIEAVDDKGTIYRMNVNEFMKVIKQIDFNIEPQKKHCYLTVA